MPFQTKVSNPEMMSGDEQNFRDTTTTIVCTYHVQQQRNTQYTDYVYATDTQEIRNFNVENNN